MRTRVLDARASLVATFALTAVCGIGFPAAVWVLAQLFPDHAQGSLVRIGGIPRGSSLIGQQFTAPHYFHPRPSAAGNGYDATNSGGSNLPPSSQALRGLIEQRAKDYRTVNGIGADVPVPADALTASASGLDPHITTENAATQMERVARARGMTRRRVADLVAAHTEFAALGIIGRPRVNVLMLNLALDREQPVVKRGSALEGGQQP